MTATLTPDSDVWADQIKAEVALTAACEAQAAEHRQRLHQIAADAHASGWPRAEIAALLGISDHEAEQMGLAAHPQPNGRGGGGHV